MVCLPLAGWYQIAEPKRLLVLLMAIKWRLRRVLVALSTMFSAAVVYFAAWSPEQTSVKEMSVTTQLTYINRPLDLSTHDGRMSRLEQVQNACASHPEGDTMNILVYERKPSLRMSYCVVPKAGCTFWIRIFRFLNNDTGGTLARTPFDIDRLLAHDVSRRTMKMYRLQNPDDKHVVDNSTRFLFARDPYTRVWSAYVDKLLLPNMWGSTGKKIVARRPNATARSRACGNDVTFREFVEYIVQHSEWTGSDQLNGHWRPIQYVCDPCQFKPHFIGKQETFMTDAQVILKHLHLEDLLQGYDKNAHLRDEISLLTGFNFALLKSIPPECATPMLLAKRLWAAFQLNGYLSPFRNSTVLDRVAPGLLTAETFMRLVYREQEQHWEELQLAGFVRRKVVAEEYKQLPRDLLEQFAQVYAKDFEYFGYEKHPKDIFV